MRATTASEYIPILGRAIYHHIGDKRREWLVEPKHIVSHSKAVHATCFAVHHGIAIPTIEMIKRGDRSTEPLCHAAVFVGA